MPTTGFDGGPFSLTAETIKSVVTTKSPGAYALGYSKNSTFYIKYVGRSDDNLANRLNDWVGHYQEFKAGYLSSAKMAFEKECHLYHDFSPGLDNKVHPARPTNSNWGCPRCRNFD